MDVAAWLLGLGLQQYESVSRDNDIDGAVLPLTAEDLKNLGITLLGHCRRLLGAIAALNDSGKPAAIGSILDGTPSAEA